MQKQKRWKNFDFIMCIVNHFLKYGNQLLRGCNTWKFLQYCLEKSHRLAKFKQKQNKNYVAPLNIVKHKFVPGTNKIHSDQTNNSQDFVKKLVNTKQKCDQEI